MQFRSTSSYAASASAASPLAAPSAPVPASIGGAGAPGLRPLAAGDDLAAAQAAHFPQPAAQPAAPPASPPTVANTLQGTSENLLKHIPGEATGFYVLAVSSVDNPTTGTMGIIFGCSLVLLVVARWVAKASWIMILTTLIAFFLWMQIYDKGFLNVLAPGLLPNPLGLILAGFYSALIALLANAGKIK